MQESHQERLESFLDRLTERENKPASMARTSNKSDFQPITIPPADPSVGENTQSLFLAPKNDRKHNLSTFRLLDSCIMTISALYFLRRSLIVEFSLGHPRPLTFQEMIFIGNLRTQTTTTPTKDQTSSAAPLKEWDRSSKEPPTSIGRSTSL